MTVGDNVHGIGEWENYQVFAGICRDLEMPLYQLIGNHDHGPNTRNFDGNPYGTREFGNFLWAQKRLNAPELVNYSFNAGDWHFVLAAQPGGCDGFLDRYPEWLKWLDADLKQHRERPTFFFAHHPLLPVSRTHFDSYNMNAANRARLAEVLTRYGNVKYAFFGHVHNSVASIPLISWRWRGGAFIMMPNAANVVRFNDFHETFKSSWGTGIVEVDGSRVTSLKFHTLESEVVPIDPAQFEEYDHDKYCFLRPLGGMPSPKTLANAGFEDALRGTWFVNDVIPYGKPQIHRHEIRAGSSAEGKRCLYLYTKATKRPRPPKNYVVAEARQAVAAPAPGLWPQLHLKYRIESKEFRGTGGGCANVMVSGHEKGSAKSKFVLLYQLGSGYTRFGIKRLRGPVVALRRRPELDRWADLVLNVRADYERHFETPSWSDLNLYNLVITLGNFNDDYAPGGVQTEIGVGFDDVAWHMASEARSPTAAFELVELIGDGQGRR